MVFNQRGQILGQHQLEIPQFFPQDGWVEHDPEAIWETVLSCCRQALSAAQLQAEDIAGIGISNQRETTVVWERETGKPVYPAIVWQDRRTAGECQNWIAEGHQEMMTAKTGLLCDPYFSASKIAWILAHVDGARKKAEAGQLAFGTIDSFLLWRLTEGKSHYTDATNAARTLLFNIHQQGWDDALLRLFNIPRSLLPTVLDSSADFGQTASQWFGAPIPIAGMAGDQQAALIGQACFQPGMLKSTYGTGCFMMLNTGAKALRSQHRLLTTIAYRLHGQATYAIEGSIFVAGAAIQWLRDALKLIKNAQDTQALAETLEDTNGVYLVPAFTGLGAPYWDPAARGTLVGLTRDSGVAHIVRAALEATCYQSRDLMVAMRQDGADAITRIRVDGGMVSNDWLMQFLADLLFLEVERSQIQETSAFGAACLAGLQTRVFDSLSAIEDVWHQQHCFQPKMSESRRQQLYQGWHQAVQRVLSPNKA